MHTPALRIGTHFLLTLEIVVFLFHLLSTTSKPFSSLSTARLRFFYKKTRYINSLLLTVIIIKSRSVLLKMVPFESLGSVSYSHSIATMTVSLAVLIQYTNVTDRHTATHPPHDNKGIARK